MNDVVYRDALTRVLDGKTFARSHRSRALLRYVVERALDDPEAVISGPVIAQDVFGRGAAFDASSDPIVRVQMRRVRDLLEDYYTNEAPSDPVRITIPKGTYRPHLALTGAPDERLAGDGEPIDAQPSAPPAPDEFPEPPVDPVPQEELLPALSAEPVLTSGVTTRSWRRYQWSAAVVLTVLAVALVVYWSVRPASVPESGYPTIAILPFQNLTGDPENEVFATGFQHQFAADLRRFNTVRVGVVRGEVGPQYDYILNGDIVSVGDTVDLHMRLTERASGNEIARRRLQSSGAESDYFEALTNLSSATAAGIAWPAGAAAEQYLARSDRPGFQPVASSEAFLCLARFRAFTNSKSERHFRRAYACLEQMVGRHPSDPVLGAAWAWLIALSSPQALQIDIPELAESSSLERAEEVALKSVELDPSTDVAHEYLGLIRGIMGKTSGAIDSMMRAQQQNPANPDILANLAVQHAFMGDWEAARRMAQQARERAFSPPPPWYVTPLYFDALVHGDGETAVSFASGLALGEDPNEAIYTFAAASLQGNDAVMDRERDNVRAIADRFDGDPLFIVRRWVWSQEIVNALADALRRGGIEVQDASP